MRAETGGMRIMGYQHNSFLQFSIERGENFKDLFSRTRVQITGWLVCQDQIRISDNGPRNSYALFLSTR